MFGSAAEERAPDGKKMVRKGVTREQIKEVWSKGGQLSRAELLQCRIRYFTVGAAIGSKAYVNEVFAQNRDHFGPKRQTGSRPMRHGQWDGLCSMRDLKMDVIRAPG